LRKTVFLGAAALLLSVAGCGPQPGYGGYGPSYGPGYGNYYGQPSPNPLGQILASMLSQPSGGYYAPQPAYYPPPGYGPRYGGF
jgi:hypothetical protein